MTGALCCAARAVAWRARGRRATGLGGKVQSHSGRPFQVGRSCSEAPWASPTFCTTQWGLFILLGSNKAEGSIPGLSPHRTRKVMKTWVPVPPARPSGAGRQPWGPATDCCCEEGGTGELSLFPQDCFPSGAHLKSGLPGHPHVTPAGCEVGGALRPPSCSTSC